MRGKPNTLEEVPAILLANREVDKRGCWLWTGTTNPAGYGTLRVMPRMWMIHRLAAWAFKGLSLDDERWVLHHCDVKRCFNPAHLFFGDHRANVDDMMAKKRNQHGATHYRARLTEEDVKLIRLWYGGGEITQREIAEVYGVSQTAVSKAIRGSNWRHVA